MSNKTYKVSDLIARFKDWTETLEDVQQRYGDRTIEGVEEFVMEMDLEYHGSTIDIKLHKYTTQPPS